MKRIVCVDSLHCGSIYGLLPKSKGQTGFETSGGNLVIQNPGQRYLWECWLHFWQEVGKSDAVVVMGDVIDGPGRKNGGVEKCLPLIGEQVEAARECLEVVRTDHLYFVQGTEYHDLKGAEAVEQLAKQMNAEHYPGLGTGYYSKETMDLDVDGTVINCAHHGPGVSGLYRATGADKEGIFSALAGKEGKSPKAEVLVRGHNHFFIHVEHASKHIIYLPCWQLQTRFMRHGSVYRMIPDIGGVVLDIENRKEVKGDPVKMTKILYDLPPVKLEVLK